MAAASRREASTLPCSSSNWSSRHRNRWWASRATGASGGRIAVFTNITSSSFQAGACREVPQGENVTVCIRPPVAPSGREIGAGGSSAELSGCRWTGKSKATCHPRAASAAMLGVADGALIARGSRSGRFGRVLLGSTSRQLAHHAPCPVWSYPPTTDEGGCGSNHHVQSVRRDSGGQAVWHLQRRGL